MVDRLQVGCSHRFPTAEVPVVARILRGERRELAAKPLRSMFFVAVVSSKIATMRCLTLPLGVFIASTRAGFGADAMDSPKLCRAWHGSTMPARCGDRRFGCREGCAADRSHSLFSMLRDIGSAAAAQPESMPSSDTCESRLPCKVK